MPVGLVLRPDLLERFDPGVRPIMPAMSASVMQDAPGEEPFRRVGLALPRLARMAEQARPQSMLDAIDGIPLRSTMTHQLDSSKVSAYDFDSPIWIDSPIPRVTDDGPVMPLVTLVAWGTDFSGQTCSGRSKSSKTHAMFRRNAYSAEPLG